MHTIQATGRASGLRVAIVVSKYNEFVTERLQAGALAALASAGVDANDVTVVRVPGAFEIPLAAQHAAESGRFDAVVCLGCVIRGETPHFEYLSSAVSHGLTTAAAATGVPMGFGVLTTNSVEEALARAADGPGNKGQEAAMAAMFDEPLMHRIAEVIDNLKCGRLLPCDAVGINGIHDREIAGLAQFANDSQRVIEIAVNRDDFRSVGKSLKQFPGRDFSRRQNHDA
jgi:6,7-dimethyl-8-ribityllumazine synthase